MIRVSASFYNGILLHPDRSERRACLNMKGAFAKEKSDSYPSFD